MGDGFSGNLGDFLKIVDNTTTLLGDDLKRELSGATKFWVAAACFSIYAFDAPKSEMGKLKERGQHIRLRLREDDDAQRQVRTAAGVYGDRFRDLLRLDPVRAGRPATAGPAGINPSNPPERQPILRIVLHRGAKFTPKGLKPAMTGQNGR